MKHFRKATNEPSGKLLIEQGVIQHEQLQLAIENQKVNGGLIGEIFVQLNFATEKDIAQALTTQYGFPYLPLANYEIDPEVMSAVPENICREFFLVPIDKIGKSLTIATSDPLNVKALEDIELLTGCTVQTFITTMSEVKQAFEKHYKKLA